tara:strand:- start:12 stop:185 length:174 start_codon:yes stop_codon:yes gene_type:complete
MKKPITVGKALCVECKKDAKIYYNGSWYCSIKSDIGTFNMSGYCKNTNTVIDKKGKH